MTVHKRGKKNLYEVQHAAQIWEPIWISKRALSVLKRVISIQCSSMGSSALHTTETPVKSRMIRTVKLIRKPGGKDKLDPSSQIPGAQKDELMKSLSIYVQLNTNYTHFYWGELHIVFLWVLSYYCTEELQFSSICWFAVDINSHKKYQTNLHQLHVAEGWNTRTHLILAWVLVNFGAA